MNTKKILYCGYGIPVNIGNGFIDLGALYSLKTACPEDEIYSVSNIQAEFKRKYGNRLNLFNLFNISEFDSRIYIEADILVFAGALFNSNFILENKILLDFLIKTKKPVIIYGGSGCENYSIKEFAKVFNYFNKLNIIGFVSRDNKTFDSFKALTPNSFNGIDCAFFLNNCYQPPKLTLKDFAIYTFDDIKEPNLETNKKILRLQHDPWRLGRIERLIKHPFNTLSIGFRKDFMSDRPADYIDLYANCDEVYSDRVHACVAALVYGKKARYFGKSPRSYLFERIGVNNINKELVNFDISKLADIKVSQIEFLKKCIEDN